jgi:hypothetical protein
MWDCKTRASVFVTAALLFTALHARAEPPRLDLVWVDPTGIATGTYPVLSAASRAALASIGAEVAWTAAPHGAVVGPESLVVIALPTHQNGRGRERHVMGATRIVADGALAVWVFPDQVAWALGLDLDRRAIWGKRSEAHFGRALGRVASHEILHALGVSEHTHGGLMAARLDRKALTSSGSPRVDHATVATVRRAFDRGVLSASGSWTPSLLRSTPLPGVPELLAAPGPGR